MALLALAFALGLLWVASLLQGGAGDALPAPGGLSAPGRGAPTPGLASAVESGDARIAAAFASRATDLPVSGSGRVQRILRDDDNGHRHQRFVLELANGMTLLVAHNIDLAPRIEALGVGDTVQFNGVYEWNARGGVVHWTHHDPDGRRPGGWLEHAGHRYR